MYSSQFEVFLYILIDVAEVLGAVAFGIYVVVVAMSLLAEAYRHFYEFSGLEGESDVFLHQSCLESIFIVSR